MRKPSAEHSTAFEYALQQIRCAQQLLEAYEVTKRALERAMADARLPAHPNPETMQRLRVLASEADACCTSLGQLDDAHRSALDAARRLANYQLEMRVAATATISIDSNIAWRLQLEQLQAAVEGIGETLRKREGERDALLAAFDSFEGRRRAAALGPDADELTASLASARSALESWDLREAGSHVAEVERTLDRIIEERRVAVSKWMEARASEEAVAAELANIGAMFRQPPRHEPKTTAELHERAAELRAWITEATASIADHHEEQRKRAAEEALRLAHEADARLRANEVAAETAALLAVDARSLNADDQPKSAAGPEHLQRPIAGHDAIVARLNAAEAVDPIEALEFAPDVSYIRYLERVRGLLARDRHSWRNAVDLLDARARERDRAAMAAWLWVLTEDSRVPISDEYAPLLRSLCDGLAARSAGAPALALTLTLGHEPPSSQILDSVYFEFARSGPEARARLIRLAPQWEPSGALPPPEEPRAWIVALSLVEAALFDKPSGDATRRARSYLAGVPKEPAALWHLLAATLEETRHALGTEDGVERDDATAASEAAEIRQLIARRRQQTDRWSSEALRHEERDFWDEVEACLHIIESRRNIQELKALELPQVKEKRIRASLRERARGRRDPADLGSRFAAFVGDLEDYVKRLERIRRLTYRELMHPNPAGDPRGAVRDMQAALSPQQGLVARSLLEGLQSPGISPVESGSDVIWDQPWIDQPLFRGVDPASRRSIKDRFDTGRRILENIIVSAGGGNSREAMTARAYFALGRGEMPSAALADGDVDERYVWDLATHARAVLRSELDTLASWTGELRLLEQRHAVHEPMLGTLAAQVDSARSNPTAIALDLLAKQLGETEIAVRSRVDSAREDASRLLRDLAAQPSLEPLPQRLLSLAERELVAERYGIALAAARHATDAVQSPNDSSLSAASTFLASNEVARADTVGTDGQPQPVGDAKQFGEELYKLDAELRMLRAAGFRVESAEAALVQARAAMNGGAATRKPLEGVRAALDDAALLDEPPDFPASFVKIIPGAASRTDLVLTQDAYAKLIADGRPLEDVAEALAKHAAVMSTQKAPRAGYRAAQAEWTRVRALIAADRGDWDEARRLCEQLCFLVRRWGEAWTGKVNTAQASDDPGVAVSTLLAGYLIARARREAPTKAPASWLSEQAKQGGFSHDSIRQALSATSPRHLARLFGIAWTLAATDMEAELMQSLHRMGQLAVRRPSLWIAELLGREVGADSNVSARKKLGAMLTAFLARERDWSLDVLEHLVRSGRLREDVSVGEWQSWQNLARHLSAFAGATGKRLQQSLARLIELTLRLERSESELRPLVQGMRTTLLALEKPRIQPELVVDLEEGIATIDGSGLEFVLAFTNSGTDTIYDIQIHSLSKSEVLVASANDPIHIDEPLFGGQTIVRRLHGELHANADDDHAQLGIKLACRGNDEHIWEYPPFERDLEIRPRAEIPTIDRSLLKQLFNESGIEVTQAGKNFFGRNTELDDLRTGLLEKDPPDAIFLQGMRRIGKTSLAKVFLNRAREHGHYGAFVDFKGYSDAGSDGEIPVPPWRTFGFLACRVLEVETPDGRLAQHFAEYRTPSWRRQIMEQFRAAAFPADLLRELLESAADALQSGCIIVVLDELDVFARPWEANGQARQNVYNFFNVMRGLLASQDGSLGRYRWLLSGSDRCVEMFRDYGNPLYGSISQMRLAGVRRDECDEIIRGPFRDRQTPVSITESALRELYELTRGMPFFVKIIGSRLCNVLIEQPTDLVSRWHIREAVLRSLPDNAAGEAAASYDRLLEPIKDRPDGTVFEYVLGLIAARTSAQEPSVPLDDILSHSEQLVGARLSRQEIMSIGRELKKYEIVEIDGDGDPLSFRIAFPLVRQLVKAKYDYHPAVMKEAVLKYLDERKGADRG